MNDNRESMMQPETRTIQVSDLQKILDALESTKSFLELRDEMNARMHLAPNIRYSPLTSAVEAAHERLRTLLL